MIHTYIAYVQLMSIALRNFSNNSASIRVQMSSLNWAVLYSVLLLLTLSPCCYLNVWWFIFSVLFSSMHDYFQKYSSITPIYFQNSPKIFPHYSCEPIGLHRQPPFLKLLPHLLMIQLGHGFNYILWHSECNGALV